MDETCTSSSVQHAKQHSTASSEIFILPCLFAQEFSDWIVSRDNTFEMAYAIEQDKVANMTIRLQFNSDPKWTKALKYMLTNLKYCMTWVITHQNPDQAASASAVRSHTQQSAYALR